MSTVTQVAERAYRDFLLPSDDQPVVITLATAVTADAVSLTYNDDTLAPDEEDLLAPGVIIEVGTEQCRITDVDDTANTLTVTRGVNGTTKAAHAAGDEITVAPVFPRATVVRAVKDNIVSLYPSLWHVDTVEITTAASYVEVPATVITPVSLIWQNGTRYQPSPLPQLLDNFPPSTTGKAIQTYAVPPGFTAWFTFRSRFAEPATDDTDLSTLGVRPSDERIVAVGAAAQVVAGRPQGELTAEYLTEQLEREALPPGASTDLRNGLLTLRSIWIEEAGRDLRAEMQTPVSYNVVVR